MKVTTLPASHVCLYSSGQSFANLLHSLLVLAVVSNLYCVTEYVSAAAEPDPERLIEDAERILMSSPPSGGEYAEAASLLALVRFRTEGLAGANRSLLRTRLLVPAEGGRTGPGGKPVMRPNPQVRLGIDESSKFRQFAAVGRGDLIIEHIQLLSAMTPETGFSQNEMTDAVATGIEAITFAKSSSNRFGADVSEELTELMMELVEGRSRPPVPWRTSLALASVYADNELLLAASQSVTASERAWAADGGDPYPLLDGFLNLGDLDQAFRFATNHLASDPQALTSMASSLAAAGRKDEARQLIKQVPKEIFYGTGGARLLGAAGLPIRIIDELSNADPRESLIQNARRAPVGSFPYQYVEMVLSAGRKWLDGNSGAAETIWATLPTIGWRARARVQVGRELLRRGKVEDALAYLETQVDGGAPAKELRMGIARYFKRNGRSADVDRTLAILRDDPSLPTMDQAEVRLMLGDAGAAWETIAALEITSPNMMVRWSRLAADVAAMERARYRVDDAQAIATNAVSRLVDVSFPRSIDAQKRLAETAQLDLAVATLADILLDVGLLAEGDRLINGIPSPRRQRNVKRWILAQPSGRDRGKLAAQWVEAESGAIQKANLMVAQAVGLIESYQPASVR